MLTEYRGKGCRCRREDNKICEDYCILGCYSVKCGRLFAIIPRNVLSLSRLSYIVEGRTKKLIISLVIRTIIYIQQSIYFDLFIVHSSRIT